MSKALFWEDYIHSKMWDKLGGRRGRRKIIAVVKGSDVENGKEGMVMRELMEVDWTGSGNFWL